MTTRRISIAIMRSVIAAVVMACADIAPAQTADPAPQEPAWRLVRGDSQCALIGLLSPHETHLYVQSLPGTDYYRIAISGKDLLPASRGRPVRIGLVFHGRDARFDRQGSSIALPNNMGTVVEIDGVEADVIQALAQASSLSLEEKGRTTPPFQFQNADKATAALDKCIADRLIAWGADPEQFKPGGATPIALVNRDAWIPNDAMVGMTRFIRPNENALNALLRVSVSESGRVDGCNRVNGPAESAFELQACTPILSKQLFKPAHDPGGKPVRGTASFEIHLMSLAR